jgi:hypothetical protein
MSDEAVNPKVGVSVNEITSGIAAVEKLITLAESLPFVPSSVKTGLADLQKVLGFFSSF